MADGTDSSVPTRSHRGLHWIAILTACATFPLIFMGGLVTSHGAGLAVPDWPNSFGYNMFLFPPDKWVGGIFYEHTHRLAGTLVGLLSIAMVAWAWAAERRRWVRWLAVGVLAAVIFQGILGGLRVVWKQLDMAIVHACLAQAFFCLAALMVAATSRWWSELAEHAPVGDYRKLVRVGIISAVLIYLQLIAGAVMRHEQAGLAIPDFPLSYGSLLPPMSSAALEPLNRWREQQADLAGQAVTLGQVWIHFLHRIGAVLVAGAVVHLVVEALVKHRSQRLLTRLAVLLAVLLVAQITLGAMTVLWRKPADIASTHVAVGAMTLYVTFMLTVRGMRLRAVGSRASSATARPQDLPGQAPAGAVPA